MCVNYVFFVLFSNQYRLEQARWIFLLDVYQSQSFNMRPIDKSNILFSVVIPILATVLNDIS